MDSMQKEGKEANPLVSIVIPSYNAANFLRESIDSVLNQTYPNIELIVLDDGSTDNTQEILAAYPPDNFFWEHHANMGQSATLNKGWTLAKGEILGYLSADDLLLPDAVAHSVDYLRNHDSVIMTYCDYMLIDENSKDIRRVQAPEFDYLKMVSELVVQPGPGVFFRKAGFNNIGGWNTSYRQVPDLEYWLRLGLEGEFHRIPEVLAKFRVHGESQSFAPSSVNKSEEIVDVILNFFSRSDLPDFVKELQAPALAFAHVSAARYHIRAGRTLDALSHLLRAWKTDMRVAYSKRTFLLIGNAILFRLRYFLHKA